MSSIAKNYAAWSLPLHSSKTFQQLNREQRLTYLCAVAHLAPSSHNSQPWRFSIDAAHYAVTIFLDRTAILPASDTIGRQAIISIGCTVETLLIAGNHMGLKTKIEQFQGTKKSILPLPATDSNAAARYIRLATVTFFEDKKTIPPRENLFEQIFSRMVMRAEFDPERSIPAALARSLQSAAKSMGVWLHAITDTVRRAALAEFQAQADGYVINTREFSRELGDWLLPNNSTSGLGMPGSGFGLRDDEANRLHKGLSGQTPLRPEDGLKFALMGKAGIEKSPLIVAITVKQNNVAQWLLAGQAFQRMALLIEQAGLNIAVHAGIVEVGLISKIFSATMGTTKKVAVVFRVGYVKHLSDLKRPHSPRQQLTEVLL